MIETERKFSQVKVEKLLWYSAIHIEPMLSITPEAFNAIEMVSSFRTASLFSDHHMMATHAQRSIGVPIIGVIQTPWFGVLSHESFNDLARASGDRKHSDYAVALKDAEDNH